MLGEIVGRQVAPDVTSELPVSLAVVGPYGRPLERAEHALGLTIGPRMAGASQTVLDAMSSAKSSERTMEPVAELLAGRVELDAVVHGVRVDAVGDGLAECLEERDRGAGGGPQSF